MRVTVLGWTGKRNVGDEAYRSAFPLLLPRHQLKFCDHLDATGPEPVAVLLGGGDVVYPEFTEQFTVFPKARCLVASVTLTAASDFAFLRTCEKVFVRDLRSLGHADANGVTASYLPDAAFVLEGDRGAGRRHAEELFRAEGHELYERLVVVVCSAYLMGNGAGGLARDQINFESVSRHLAAAFDATPASFLFVPFGTSAPNDDRASNARVASLCKWSSKNVVLYDRLNVRETLDLVAAADAVVSSRLHASIFATLCGVPVIDIVHHDKGLGFAELVGQGVCPIPYWEFAPARFREALRESLSLGGHDPRLSSFTRRSRESLRNASLL